MSDHDHHNVEQPRFEPEIIPPSATRGNNDDYEQLRAGIDSSFVRFKVKRIGPFQLIASLAFVFIVMMVLLFLFASAFIFVAGFVAFFVLFSIVIAYVRRFLHR